MIILSRSAIDTYQACPQKFYLQYQYKNHGIVESKSDLDLTIGSAIHLFFETIFRANLGENYNYSNELMEEGIQLALDYFNNEINQRPLLLKAFEIESDKIIEEHLALIEALCYTYWINKFEEHHKRFEFLEVEQEEIIRLGTIEVNGVFEDIIYVAKADGLWRNRDNNLLYVLSNKVISGYLSITARNYQISSQNTSELFVINRRILNLKNNIIENGITPITPLEKYIVECITRIKTATANHILYNILIKGQRREEPYQSGIYRRNSVLIRPYKFQISQTANPFSKFQNIEVNEQSGQYKLVLGKGKPPKGWGRVEIWQDNEIGVRNFIDLIKRGLVQPENGNYLDTITREPEDDVFKTDDEIELFEKRLKYKVFNDIVPKIVANINGDENAQVIFDINTHSCYDWFGKDCAFVEFCHSNEDINSNIENNLNLNLYQIRKPHHKLEEELFIQKGYIENEEGI